MPAAKLSVLAQPETSISTPDGTIHVTFDPDSASSWHNTHIDHFIYAVHTSHISDSFDPTAVPDPKSLKEALSRPDAHLWREAIAKEVSNLFATGTIRIVSRPPPPQPVGSGMFVFKRKTLEDGSLDKYKGRYVLRGNSQVKGIDYINTFAPTLRHGSLRVFAQIVIDHGWDTRSGDVPGAYLNPTLDKPIYIEQIQGFATQPPGTPPIADPKERRRMYVCQVLTGLYGGCDSGYLWARHRDTTFRSLGLTQCRDDNCVWFSGTISDPNFVLLVVYVDDIVITGPHSTRRTTVWDGLVSKYNLEDKGPLKWFLALGFEWSPGCVKITQTKFTEDLLARFGMEDCNAVSTPLPSNFSTNGVFTAPTGEGIAESDYRSAVGGLLYLTNTRPDLSFAVGYLARHMASPSPLHLRLVKHVLRYIKGTTHLGIYYRATPASARGQLTAWLDADFAGDESFKSTSGAAIYMNVQSAPVWWSSRRQSVPATSTCHAETIAGFDGAKEIIAHRGLLHELGYLAAGPTIAHGDNEGMIMLTQEYATARRSRHFAAQTAWLRMQCIQGVLIFDKCATALMRADGLTKALGRQMFAKHRDWLLGLATSTTTTSSTSLDASAHITQYSTLATDDDHDLILEGDDYIGA
jgi:hypothetical protein